MILRRFSWVLSVLGISAMVITECGGDGRPPQVASADTPVTPNRIALSEAQRAEVSVETTTIAERPVTTTLQLPARVRPSTDQEAFATALDSGRVEQLHVSAGDRVEKGEVLADVAAPDLSRMVADLRQSRDELERQRRLDERGVAIEKTLRAAQRQWQAARQRLRGLEVPGASLSAVNGCEADLGGGEAYGPQVSPYAHMVKLAVVCSASRVEPLAHAIAEEAQMGRRKGVRGAGGACDRHSDVLGGAG